MLLKNTPLTLNKVQLKLLYSRAELKVEIEIRAQLHLSLWSQSHMFKGLTICHSSPHPQPPSTPPLPFMLGSAVFRHVLFPSVLALLRLFLWSVVPSMILLALLF